MSVAANVSLPSMSLEPPPPPLQIKLLSAKARAPTRGSDFAAGYDLYSSQATIVPARGKVLVDTDISIAVPAGTCMSNRSIRLNQHVSDKTHRWQSGPSLWTCRKALN